jgi:hypothetical protein
MKPFTIFFTLLLQIGTASALQKPNIVFLLADKHSDIVKKISSKVGGRIDTLPYKTIPTDNS